MKGKYEKKEKWTKRAGKALREFFVEGAFTFVGVCVCLLLGLPELDESSYDNWYAIIGVIVIGVCVEAIKAILRLIRKKKKSCDTEQEETSI